jgi:hypothetical protein
MAFNFVSMTALGDQTTTTFGLGKFVVVWDSLITAGIIVATGFAIHRRSKYWGQANILYAGMVLLSLYGFFNWVDVVIHESKASVRYSYILTDAFYNTIRILSEILMVWGVFNVLARYEKLRPTPPTPDRIVIGLFTLVGCYLICLKFAVCISWLSMNDVKIIESLAKAKNGFEIAFTALQFVLGIMAIMWADSATKYKPPMYQHEKERMCFACCALIARSFCEIVIAGQLDRHPTHLQTILRARNVCYHLFSLAFIALVAFTTRPDNPDEADPLALKEEAAVQQARDFLIDRLDFRTRGRLLTAPKFGVLLDDLRNHAPLKSPEMEREIKRLEAEYGDWEPVYKWQAPDDRDPRPPEIQLPIVTPVNKAGLRTS